MRYQNRTRAARRAAFTLIEILLVLVIVSVVAGAAVLGIFTQQDAAYRNLAKSEIGTLGTALKTYRINCGSYPSELRALWEKPSDLPSGSNWAQALEKAKENDPWETPYEYKQSGSSYEIRSAGPDRQMNTDDDITS